MKTVIRVFDFEERIDPFVSHWSAYLSYPLDSIVCVPRTGLSPHNGNASVTTDKL